MRPIATEPAAERVITRTIEALGPVREVLPAVDNVPRVAALHELPLNADVNALPVLTDPERRGFGGRHSILDVGYRFGLERR